MNPESVEIVLVRPSRAANVAAACRAMKNMGLRTLRLVSGGEDLTRPDIRGLAYGAWDVLDAARRHSTLAEAVAGSTVVAGTSARADQGDWTARRFAEQGGGCGPGERVSIVFGPEATGLTNQELKLCHLRVRIPTVPQHASLNLAQAVLVVAYEILVSTGFAVVGQPTGAAPFTRANAGEIEDALGSLRQALLAIGYLNPQNPDLILAELRGLLVRAAPTPREIALLRGIARQISWAGCRVASQDRASG